VTHDKAVTRALLACTRAGARAWRFEVGTFADLRTGQPHHIGVKGMSDILGLCRGGRFLSIEVKTGNATRTAGQLAWARMVEALGGLYVLARYDDETDGDATIRTALKGTGTEVPA
jgi:hypothetical protein